MDFHVSITNAGGNVPYGLCKLIVDYHPAKSNHRKSAGIGLLNE